MSQPVPMISAATLRGMPEFITAELSPHALRRAYDLTGLPVGVMDVENAYIPETSLVGFIDQAAREAGESHIGLHLAPYLTVRSYGPWGSYVLEATTLGGCLTRCANAIDLHASYRSWNTSVEGDRAWLRYKFPSAGRQGYANLAICGVGVLINIIRSYAGPDWQPDAIELDVTRPTRLTEFHDTFPCEIRFAANSIGIEFHSDLLDRRPFQSAECGVTTLADVRRSRVDLVPTDLADAVAEIIRVQIYKGHVDMDAAARSLDIGVRRLRRALDRDGASYREITKRVRIKMAKELLAETSLPISAIGTHIGYANPALFSRAFARDVGVRPTTYRSRARNIEEGIVRPAPFAGPLRLV
jgi:AraC-like DNA-binding protein